MIHTKPRLRHNKTRRIGQGKLCKKRTELVFDDPTGPEAERKKVRGTPVKTSCHSANNRPVPYARVTPTRRQIPASAASLPARSPRGGGILPSLIRCSFVLHTPCPGLPPSVRSCPFLSLPFIWLVIYRYIYV